MSDEEKKEYEELKSLLYTGTISQYGKRKLIDLIEKQSKEIEELKEKNKFLNWYFENQKDNFVHKNKIKAKIEELEKEKNIPQEMDFKAFYRIKDLKNIEIAVLQSLLEKE